MSSTARGRAGKYNKPSRGGGKKFSRNLTPLDADGNPVSMWSDPQDRKGASDDSDSDDSSEEDSSEDDSSGAENAKTGGAGGGGEDMTREERKAAAKKRKEAAIAKKSGKAAAPGDLPPSDSDSDSDEEEEKGDMPANPNHTAKARNLAAGKTPSGDGAQLSRREREAVQAQQARERYQKLHAEGKTDEARADLARLKLIREKREADAARKQAEKEEKEAAEQRRLDEMDDRERRKREAALGTADKAEKGGKKKGKK